MGHDERSDEARADAPGRRPHKLPRALARLEVHLEGSREVLPQEVARAALQRPPVLVEERME